MLGDQLLNALIKRSKEGDPWAQETCAKVFDFIAAKVGPNTHNINTLMKSRSWISFEAVIELGVLFRKYSVPMDSVTFYELFRGVTADAGKLSVDVSIRRVETLVELMQKRGVRVHFNHVKVLKSSSFAGHELANALRLHSGRLGMKPPTEEVRPPVSSPGLTLSTEEVRT